MRGENPLLPAVMVLVALAIPFMMGGRLTPGPRGLLPAIEIALLVIIAIADRGRIDRRSHAVRRTRITLIAILAIAATWSAITLTADLVLDRAGYTTADVLLKDGALVWINLVIVFAFIYWEHDDGGPGNRAHALEQFPELAFTQQLNPDICPPGWRPMFADYLYLSLTNGISLSPSDTMPLARWAKFVMGTQSITSLLVIALVLARAVNILH